jgi:hypothetical protein
MGFFVGLITTVPGIAVKLIGLPRRRGNGKPVLVTADRRFEPYGVPVVWT